MLRPPGGNVWKVLLAQGTASCQRVPQWLNYGMTTTLHFYLKQSIVITYIRTCIFTFIDIKHFSSQQTFCNETFVFKHNILLLVFRETRDRNHEKMPPVMCQVAG